VGVSRFYRTAALGGLGGPDFLNGVVAVETDLDPRALKLSVLCEIERELGRERGDDRTAPRTIDLDLVLYGDLTCEEDGLILPDPDIVKRAFLADALLELEPELALPGSGERLRGLATGLLRDGMVLAETFNARLRRVGRPEEETR
jgi:2-amino-4-hydroxy-6-hydroxymethyldihydropteridine diphosphokinase